MKLEQIFDELSSRGVKIWADSGQLRLRAPKGAVSASLQEGLREHKTEILNWLQSSQIDLVIPVVDRGQPLPASFMQERLWFLNQMYPQGVAYNLPNGRLMMGLLDIQSLRRSLEYILKRHESLRTTFRYSNGRCLQVVSSQTGLDFEYRDLRKETNSQEVVLQLANLEANHHFDLSAGPLFRVRVLRLRDDQHLMIWTLHHIISDGWSSMLFLRELKALYEEYIGGDPAELADLPVQYPDFAAWERSWLEKDGLNEHLGYWQERLSGQLPVLNLALDYPRPAVFNYRGKCYPLVFGKELSDALKKLAQRFDTTFFVVILSAFKVFLNRLSGQSDICVGSPVARRNWAGIENLLGCFINTLALRTDLSGDPEFSELLARVSQTCTGAFSHQDVPFEKIVETLAPVRDSSHTPFFQYMFIFHVQDLRKISHMGNLNLEVVEFHTQGSKMDLTMEIKETTQGLEGWIEYSTELFDTARVEELAAQFGCLLEQVVVAPECRISALRLMDEGKRHRAVVEWNETATTFSREQRLHEALERQARQRPEAVAVVSGTETLSYGDLEARANQVARHLRTLGIDRGSRVGVYLGRTPQMVVGVLGILKAGAAYVPLDPTFPLSRLDFMVRDAELSLIVSERALMDSLPGNGVAGLLLDAQWSEISEHESTPLLLSGAVTDLAYVIYTSGSTGLPKGVEVEHRSVVNFLESMACRPGLGTDDTLLAVTTLSFDISVLELYLPLLVGAQVWIATSEQAADGRALKGILDTGQVTVMQATPASWRMLLDSGWRGDGCLKGLCGGERLGLALAQRLLAECGELWNMYGPTETTVWSLIERMDTGMSMVSVGRPIANTQAYLVDGDEALVPVGVAGELCFGGIGVARGYRNQPTLTAERFVSNPFVRGERMYRTGDVGRYFPDGRIEIMGRLDHQVKVRGFRIELGEVGTVLESHPLVSQAVVATYEESPEDVHLVGYVVACAGEEDVTVSSLRDYLASKLPRYMVPSRWVMMEALPMTPNQKVDRKALPVPEREGPRTDHEFLTPRTPNEVEIARIWAEVLGVEQVGVYDNFFALGGHSLLAPQVMSRIADAFGVELKLLTFFEGPTVAHLAELIGGEEGASHSLSSPGVVVIRQAGTESPFFAVGSHPRYKDIASHIDSNRPFYKLDVYALQSVRQAKRQRLFRTIEEIADAFKTEIQRIQPHGPYYIGGGCEGALVALEIALKLQSQGEVIAFLCPWVAVAPGAWKNSVYHRASWLHVLDQIRSMLGHPRARQMRWNEWLTVLRHEYIEYRIFCAMETYQPAGRINAPLVFMRTTVDANPDEEDCNLGWAQITSDEFNLCAVPGTHVTWLNEHAPLFGEILNEHLNRMTSRLSGNGANG